MKKLLIPLLCLSLLLGGCAVSRPTDAVTAFYASLYPDQTITREEDGSIRITQPVGKDLSCEAAELTPASTEEGRWEIESAQRQHLICRVWNESGQEREMSGGGMLYASLAGAWWPIPLTWSGPLIRLYLQPGESGLLAIPLTCGWQELPAGDYRYVNGGDLPFSLDFSILRSERGDSVNCYSVNDRFPIPEPDPTDLVLHEEFLRLTLWKKIPGWEAPQLRIYQDGATGRKTWHFSDTGGELKLSWRELSAAEGELLEALWEDEDTPIRLQHWEQDLTQGEAVASAWLKYELYAYPDETLLREGWYAFYAESPGRDVDALLQLLRELQVCASFWDRPSSGLGLYIMVPGGS